MRNFTCLLLAVLVIVSISTASAGEISVYVNGKQLDMDPPPVRVDEVTMVPVTQVFEAIGASVKYDEATGTIIAVRDGTEVRFSSGDVTAYVNGHIVIMKVSPVSISGNIFIPLNFLGEAFGVDIKWQESTQAVYIETGDVTIAQVPDYMQEVDYGMKLCNEGKELANKSDYKGALEKYEKALRIFEENKFDKGISVSLNGIGNVYYKSCDYGKALNYYTKALDIDRKIGNVKSEGTDLHNIGHSYSMLGEYLTSLDYLTKSLEIQRKIGDIYGEYSDLTNLGYDYMKLGEYQKSLECYIKTLEISGKIGLSEHSLMDDLFMIGNIYEELGDYQKAIDYYSKALEIARKFGDYEIDREGEILIYIGIIYYDLRDYQKALEYYSKVGDIKREGKFFSDCINYDFLELNIGDVYLSQGELYKAYEIYSKLKDSIRLGKYYLIKKEYNKAKEKFATSLKEKEKSREAELLLSSYIGLGLSEEGLKNYTTAYGYYKKAVELIEHQRESLTQELRKNFFEGKIQGFSRLEPYEGLVRIYHHLNCDSEGLLYSESTKARLLLEEIARKYEGKYCSLPLELTKKEREINNNIASIYKQMEIAYQKDNQEVIERLEKKLKSLKEEQKKIITDLRQSYPEYASIMYPKPLKVEEIKLNSDEVLIEYEVTDTETIAYLIKDGTIIKTSSIQINRDDLTTLVKIYRGYFEDIKGYSELGNFSPETGKKLYDLLLKDLLSDVKGEKIIIVPDDILGILPFESLIMDLPSNVQIKQTPFGPCPEGVKYVGDTCSISYYQSASSLTIIRNLNKGGGNNGVFAVADPVFSSQDDRLTGMAQVNPLTDLEVIRMDAIENEGGFSFSRLSRTGDMANDLGVIFFGELVTFTGMEATESAVKSKDLSGYKYLVFATHGILDDDVPYIKEPALVLTLVNKGNEDGFLTMGEVMNMKMGADVAVLSACKTGLGRNVSGEGIMGMGRAFQYAGVKSVLMSLWSVESESTNMMTEKFFEGLKQGKNNREALRDSRAYIRSQGYEHPFFWAPFILVGD